MSENKAAEKPQEPPASAKPIAIVPRTVGTEGFSLLPGSFEELKEYVRLIAASDMVPKDFRDKPGNVLVAIQMGGELGLKPMQAVQNIAVINGRPSIYGDLGKAMLRSNGCDIEEADIDEIRKTGSAWCVITRKGQNPVRRTFSVDDAKTAGLWGKAGPWTTYPFRQMAWRAFWFAARDAASDLLKGLAGREEIEDIVVEAVPPTVTPEQAMPKRKSDKRKDAAAAETKAPEPETKEPEPETAPAETRDDSPASQDDISDILAAMKPKGVKAPTVIDEMKRRFGKDTLGALTVTESREIVQWLNS